MSKPLRFFGDWNESVSYPAVAFDEPWNGWATPVVDQDTFRRVIADSPGYSIVARPTMAGDFRWTVEKVSDDDSTMVEYYATITVDFVGFHLRSLGFTFWEADTIDTDAIVWITGHNDAGYSPDPESVSVCATQESARAICADAIDRLADFIADQEMDMASTNYATEAEAMADDDYMSLSRYASAMVEILKGTDGDYSGEFSIAIDDGRPLPTIFWVQKATVADALGDSFDSDEYRELAQEMSSR